MPQSRRQEPGTDIATVGDGPLAIRHDQTQWTDDQLAVIRHMSTEKATPADLKVFLHRCQALGLDPFAGQIHLVEYAGKPTIQVGIHGLESTARTTADRSEESIEWGPVEWCGPDGEWRDVWLSQDPPRAARVTLWRNGKKFPATAMFDEFAGTKNVWRNGAKTGETEVNSMWRSKPAHMIGKCARAIALRSAFPRQLSDTYTPEELSQRAVPGEIVRDDTPTDDLADALEDVAEATTRDQLLALWDRYAPALSVTDRSRLQEACARRANEIDQYPEPGPEPDVDTVTGEIDPPEVA